MEKPTPLNEAILNVFSRAICLYTKPQVETALDQLAIELDQNVNKKNPLFLCVVVGGIIPLGNLLPRLNFPLEVDYIHATRYKNGTVGKELDWIAEPRISLKNRTVVIVDDILDAGITLKQVIEYCKNQEAKEILTAVLVDKQNARKKEGLQQADFSGLKVDNHYVFGYGMDYKGYLRNAPGIYKVAPEDE